MEQIPIEENKYVLSQENGPTLDKDQEDKSNILIEDYELISTKAEDVLTLLRNITINKLVNVIGFKVRQVLSLDYKNIYALLYTSDSTIKKEAERTNFHLQVEIGSLDLLSLEPINDNLIPLRFVKKWKKEDIVKKELSLKYLFKLLYKVDIECKHN